MYHLLSESTCQQQTNVTIVVSMVTIRMMTIQTVMIYAIAVVVTKVCPLDGEVLCHHVLQMVKVRKLAEVSSQVTGVNLTEC